MLSYSLMYSGNTIFWPGRMILGSLICGLCWRTHSTYCLLEEPCCGPALDEHVLCGQCDCLVHSFQVVLALRSSVLIHVIAPTLAQSPRLWCFCQIVIFVLSLIILSLARAEVAAQIAKLS